MDPQQPFWLARLLAAARKTPERGTGWVRLRLREEFRTPTSGPGRALRRMLILAEDSFAALARGTPEAAVVPEGAETLYFFYDLETCPITYDFASFLALAELERRQRKLGCVYVVIVPGRRLLREADDYQAAVGPAARRNRIDDIVIPVTRLLPTCAGATVCESRKQAVAVYRRAGGRVLPADYHPRYPTAPNGRDVRRRTRAGEALFPMLRASEAARRELAASLESRVGGRRIITVTLREYPYMPGRNSNLESWIAFADGLDSRRYAVVFVRDTGRAKAPPPEGMLRHIVCQSASLDVGVRMALYELAYLNMAIMHGPMELCWYNESCRYLVFLGLGSAPQTEAEVLRRNEFRIGEPLPFARRYQRWIWERDDLPVIRREFDAMLPVLETSPSAADPAA